MRNWTMLAAGLSVLMSLQAVACTQPTSEVTESDEAALGTSVSVGGQAYSAPTLDSSTMDYARMFIKTQDEMGGTLIDGRRVVITQQSEMGGLVSARGYVVDAFGNQTPFDLRNVPTSLGGDQPLGPSSLGPRGFGLFLLALVVIVVIVVVVPPIVNSVMCSNRSTATCSCQKLLPEPTACKIGGNVTGDGTGLEAEACITKNETKCICRSITPPPAGTADPCSSLSDP